MRSFQRRQVAGLQAGMFNCDVRIERQQAVAQVFLEAAHDRQHDGQRESSNHHPYERDHRD
jgi:hypothetical protein